MERFWNKVEKTKTCWMWMGAKSTFGHGRFRINGKLYSPHRLIYEWENGEIPNNLLVCHHCDNPSCVNPNHLFLGTLSDNMKDAYDKGRLSHIKTMKKVRGEAHGQSKLTADKVKKLRIEYKKGNITYRELAERHNLHRATIMRAIRGTRWKHVK